MNRNNTITSNVVPDSERVEFAADMFGVDFPLRLEPYIYAVAGNLAKEYRGGYWAVLPARQRRLLYVATD